MLGVCTCAYMCVYMHVCPYVNMHVFLCMHKRLCVCPSWGVMILYRGVWYGGASGEKLYKCVVVA